MLVRRTAAAEEEEEEEVKGEGDGRRWERGSTKNTKDFQTTMDILILWRLFDYAVLDMVYKS